MSLYKLSVEKIVQGRIYLEAPVITDENGIAFDMACDERKKSFGNAYIPVCKEEVPFAVKRADVLEVDISMKDGQVKVIRKLPKERRRRELKRDLVERLQKK